MSSTNVLMCKQFQREALSKVVERICLVVLSLVDWSKNHVDSVLQKSYSIPTTSIRVSY